MNELMKKILSVILVASVVLGTFVFSKTAPAEAATSTSKMKRYTFIKELVTEMGVAESATDDDRMYVDYYKKLFKINDGTANVLLSKFRVTEKELESFRKKYGLSYGNSAYIVTAEKMGLLKYVSWKSYKANISRFAAVSMLVAADEYLNGETIDTETADYIIANRISDINALGSVKNRRVFAKGYALGFIKGTSLGDYSTKRACTPNSIPYATTLRDMIKMLNNPSLRYQLSPDWQMLRISTKKMPKLASYYPYILDSYPNSYYDWEFPVMKRCMYPGNDRYSVPTDEFGYLTWDASFKQLTTEERITSLLYTASLSSLETSLAAVIFPSEYDLYYKELDNKRVSVMGTHYTTSEFYTAPLDLITPEYKQQLVDIAKDYCMTVFNVDYRTIDDNTHWKEVTSRYTANQIYEPEEYIAKLKEHKVVIECDKVAADISSLWRDSSDHDGLGTNTVRVYVRYRIVSDDCTCDEYGEPDFDELVYGTGYKARFHRATLKKGDLYWTADEDHGWREECFDVSVDYDIHNQDPHVTGARLNPQFYYNYATEEMGGPKATYYHAGYMTYELERYIEDTRRRTSYENWVAQMSNMFKSIQNYLRLYPKKKTSLDSFGGLVAG